MRETDAQLPRAGVAAPLSLAVLIAVALLAALFLEASLADQRAGRASLGAARAAAVAEEALERALASRMDTSAASRPVGAVLLENRTGGIDSVATIVRHIQPRFAEVRVSVRGRSGGFRVLVGRLAYASLRPDSLAPGDLVLRPLPGNWWVPFP